MATVPWDIDLNTRPIGSSNIPVWIDLLVVDPLLQIHPRFLLKKVGQLVFSMTLASLRRFANIHGYVLLN